jgi:hypothetical protein
LFAKELLTPPIVSLYANCSQFENSILWWFLNPWMTSAGAADGNLSDT